MNNNERLVQYFDISICGKTRARDIRHNLTAPRTLDQLITEFMQLRELNKARTPISANSKLELKLEDVEEREDSWVLLINVVDGQAAHPVTQKLGGSDADREIIELGDNRGLESSAHIIIFKRQDQIGKHLALYERNINIPFNKASAFLNHLSRSAAKINPENYVKPHPNGVRGKNINTYCILNWFGHPSAEFREELERGTISDIRITSEADIVKGYDANIYPELIGTEIKMKVGRLAVALSGGNWGHLQKALHYADSLDAPFVRVQFTDQTGSSHTAMLSSDTGSMWNADKYIKKRKIEGFGNSLKTAFPVIHEGIRDKMLELLE